ncbi:WD40-repeat-containing domain protein [Irpex rosettiformis]|uniref:WD40-repeat-containing domain protein n=1 Tax=Irpex rosettiformis TaxID=378272 RepID=A0ACB8U596_9APHY|nr:WD40-repeat-containing domain protein [Irpex rosettiformis]
MAYAIPTDDYAPQDHLNRSSPRRFNRLLTSVLGSPFVTTSDLPHDGFAAMRMLVDEDLETVDGAFNAVPRAETVTRPPSPSPSFSTDTYHIVNWTETLDSASSHPRPSFSDAAPSCSFLPGPSRRSMPQGYHTPPGHPHTPYNTIRSCSAGSFKASRSLGLLPRIWEVLRESSPGKKGKRRFDLSPDLWNEFGANGYIDYANLPPLDGEEGELIDDEACFIDVRSVAGLDILAQIPEEVALHLMTFLDLSDIIACLRVSRVWHQLASDNSVWHSLFMRRREDGWAVDFRRITPEFSSPVPLFAYDHISLQSRSTNTISPLEPNWYNLYRSRGELDRRWSGNAHVVGDLEDKENVSAWEPRVRRLLGHSDSVYCVEFDSSKIVTGSRDRTIKVWSLQTGRCLATFSGHRGSVLCLKFELDFDLDNAHALSEQSGWRKGLMVSGSSDCSVCVWDLYCHPAGGGEDMAIVAELRGILTGHTGGVLDLRIEKDWIISCGKDANIFMWDRNTLELHRSFHGHEGPVNAVGVQGDRLASASGDGKMILWDITKGERLRTFEAHDRGLACIEFKGDVIVSGSNDCKIKIWDAATGECLRTLVGHESLVRTLSYEPLSGRLVSGSYDRTIKVWDIKTGKMIREFRNLHLSHIFDIKFDCSRIVRYVVSFARRVGYLPLLQCLA